MTVYIWHFLREVVGIYDSTVFLKSHPSHFLSCIYRSFFKLNLHFSVYFQLLRLQGCPSSSLFHMYQFYDKSREQHRKLYLVCVWSLLPTIHLISVPIVYIPAVSMLNLRVRTSHTAFLHTHFFPCRKGPVMYPWWKTWCALTSASYVAFICRIHIN